MKKRFLGQLVIAILICLMSTGARADTSPFKPLSLSFDPAYLSAAGGGTSVAADASMRFRAYGIYSQTSGSWDIGPDRAGNNHVLDIEDTLGMDTDGFTGGALLGWNWGSQRQWHFDLSFDGCYNFDGNKDVGSIVFNDQVFTAGVASSLHMYSGALNLGYDFWHSDAMNLTFTGNLEVRMFYIQGKLRGDLSGVSDDWSLFAPVPAVGGTLRWDITPNLYLKGTANGLYAGDLGCFVDASAELGYDFNHDWGVFVGARLWTLRLDWESDSVDVRNEAIYAGVEFRM